MVRVVLRLACLGSMLLACALVGEAAPREASLRVHVHGCGWGPRYEVTLRAGGNVEWTGVEEVGFVGVDVQTIDADRMTPIFEAASRVRWDLVPASARDSPYCGSDGDRLLWTFDDGDAIATGYDDQLREQPFSVDGGPPCIAPELKPLRVLDERVVALLRELEYLGAPRDSYRFARDWPRIHVPSGPSRGQRERIDTFVRDAWKPEQHVVHLQVPDTVPSEVSALRRRFVRAGVARSKVVVWMVPERLARGATARIVPERCVTVRGPDDAVIDCLVP